MAKEYRFRGKTLEQLKEMSTDDFAKLLSARERRTLNRGISKDHKKLLEKIRSGSFVRTHLRDMIVLPEMVGKEIGIHNGKEFIKITVADNMIGHRLGEFSQTRQKVKHSAPGLGATRSSKFVPLK